MRQEVELTLKVTLSVDANIESESLRNTILRTIGAYSTDANSVSVIKEEIVSIREEEEIYKTEEYHASSN